jgi:hypothetical protein
MLQQRDQSALGQFHRFGVVGNLERESGNVLCRERVAPLLFHLSTPTVRAPFDDSDPNARYAPSTTSPMARADHGTSDITTAPFIGG